MVGNKIQISLVIRLSLSTNNVTNQANMRMADISVDEFVAAVYQEDWYIGKICVIDHEDSEIKIPFLQMCKMAYQWPSKPDKIWVCLSDVLCKIDAPTATGETGSMFKLQEGDRKKNCSSI
jgi:hypothetical protein